MTKRHANTTPQDRLLAICATRGFGCIYCVSCLVTEIVKEVHFSCAETLLNKVMVCPVKDYFVGPKLFLLPLRSTNDSEISIKSVVRKLLILP